MYRVTPGSYEVGTIEDASPDKDMTKWRVPILAGGVEIAAAINTGFEQAQIDAVLLAGAPDLRNICIGILECLEHNDKWTKAARENAAEELRKVLAKSGWNSEN